MFLTIRSTQNIQPLFCQMELPVCPCRNQLTCGRFCAFLCDDARHMLQADKSCGLGGAK
jgi:hypothetical protein